jgi:hypothetical protein
MKSKMAVLAAAALLVLGCRNNDKGMRRGDQNYDVVQEGSASGVTSTISGPGETPPPTTASVPLTGTNADTTTAFTLPPTQTDTSIATAQQPATIAGTMPATPQAVARPRPAQAPARPRRVEQESTTMATDTVAVPKTDTTKSDTTEQPPTEDEQQAPPPPPPPPPPPIHPR